ncbi:MAG: hypothetical protein ABI678_32175 [Kofleriaceae bacterium]
MVGVSIAAMRICDSIGWLAVIACGARGAAVETPVSSAEADAAVAVSVDATPAPPAIEVVTAGAASAASESALAEWLAAHGATPASSGLSESCSELVVGTAREPAVLCTVNEEIVREVRHSDEPAFRMLERKLVVVVRAKRAVTLLDVPVRFQALDAPVRPPNTPAPPALLEVAPDGLAIQVGLPDGAVGCKGVASAAARELATLANDDRLGRAMVVLDRDLTLKVCAARGHYVWRAGRFSR